MSDDNPFELEDIEDAKIIIVANGKHYSILPVKEQAGVAQSERVAMAWAVLSAQNHFIVTPSLEEIKEQQNI